MPRRGTNIYKRKDGRWEARYVCATLENGVKKYASVYAHSYREAREKQLLKMQSAPKVNDRGINISFEQVAAQWLESIRNTVKNSTYQKYMSLTGNHIHGSPLGEMPVRFITGTSVNSFADSLLLKGLSPKTVNDILIIAGMALEYSADNYGTVKPKISRVRESQHEMRVLSREEQARFEKYLNKNTDIYKFGTLFALYTGLRIGEICAVTWEDITADTVTVNKTLHRIKKDGRTVVEITEPKTRNSNRVIPIPDFFKPTVERFRSTGSVLKNRAGKAVEPRLLQTAFQKQIRECGIGKANFHALRHTFATRCAEAGFEIRTLSEILGHKDVKTTLNKYVHSSMEQKYRNMNTLKPIDI